MRQPGIPAAAFFLLLMATDIASLHQPVTLHEEGSAQPVSVKSPTNVIRKTGEYHLFHQLAENRRLREKHVLALMAAIERKNLLEDNPLLVTKDLVIIDGQHRLEAATRLGLPVYYKVTTKATADDVAMLNSTNANWMMQDYLDHFIAQGNPDYIAVKEFADEHGILPYNAIGLLSGNSAQPGQKEIKTFEAGGFHVVNRAHAEKVIAYISDFEEVTPFYKSKSFMNALIRVSRLPAYDHKEMLRQAKLYREEFGTKYNDVRSWLNVFELVYNRRKGAANAVNFRVA